MTTEQALKIKEFATEWITKVVAKRKDYAQRLLDVIDELIPENIGEYDPYSILGAKNWDEAEGDYGCLATLCDELFGKHREINCSSFWWYTDKACDDVVCTLRVAVDLLIEQSGGVFGYTVGDLRKVFDGNIPEDIASTFNESLKEANDHEPIWL